MLIQREVTVPVKIVCGASSSWTQLIFQFEDWHFSAISLGFTSDSEASQKNLAAFEMSKLLTFDECLSAFIEYLGGSNTALQFDHLVSMENLSGQRSVAALSETVSRCDVYEGSLRYALEVKGLSSEVATGDDPIEALYKLRTSGSKVRCCGTCKNAILPIYGGCDPRLGLFCCRGRLDSCLERQMNGTLEQFEDCLSRVSCFHLCEQYDERLGPI